MDKLQKFRQCAEEFSQRAGQLSSVVEIVLHGSVASGDPYPQDVDLAVVISNFNEIDKLAKYARKMSRYYDAWGVFLFDINLSYLGSICFRKNCPTTSVDCYLCGDIPFIRTIRGFKFRENDFYSSPLEILFKRQATSLFHAQRKKLGIVENKEYKKYEDRELRCVECGEEFVLTAVEQKWYRSRRLYLPKRCQDCLEKRHIEFMGFDDFDF